MGFVKKCKYEERAKATQIDSPLKTTRTAFKPEADDSSLDGPWAALSGDRLARAGIGGLPLDGKIPADPAGVAELEGTPTGNDGVTAILGPSATGEAPTGLFLGALTEVLAEEATVGVGAVDD
ncbi:sodium/potassium/calcium exchanger 1 [Pyrus ussuriensis x Pyrus communis]|uniref:Sodium/potassium/calcium exchanger 1 n=1 Tax=Pyrus ussuriensis x Pyrus communis TaxID=2448454 RepID=A0A5N5GNL9_9ROSA|nr:sodium/potassium/calcium exchanger 1 [Pyrus ussuriensis x Pyrus communis]